MVYRTCAPLGEKELLVSRITESVRLAHGGHLKSGNVDALIPQHPNELGKVGVKMAVDYLKTDS
jgi:hypothetical protein